jgi:hypothetical protein
MSHEITSQRVETVGNFINPPFRQSALAAAAHSRQAENPERINQLNNIEVAIATGALTLENMSLTTDLL